jgi:hypothetical protein
MAQQHVTEPFPPADDLDPTEPIPLTPPIPLSQRLDAFERRVDRRFDLLHQDLLQLRQDLAPRLAKVEGTLGSRALATGKYAAVVTLVGLLGRAAAKQWPQFGEAIEAVLGALGL